MSERFNNLLDKPGPDGCWLVADLNEVQLPDQFLSVTDARAVHEWLGKVLPGAAPAPVDTIAKPSVPLASNLRVAFERFCSEHCSPGADATEWYWQIFQAGARAECSGDPSNCPENEGHGCCQPNPVAWRRLIDSPYEKHPRYGYTEEPFDGGTPLYEHSAIETEAEPAEIAGARLVGHAGDCALVRDASASRCTCHLFMGCRICGGGIRYEHEPDCSAMKSTTEPAP